MSYVSTFCIFLLFFLAKPVIIYNVTLRKYFVFAVVPFRLWGICTHIIFFFINLLLSWLLLGKTLWPTANVSAGLDLWHCWKLFQSSRINFSLPNAWQRSTRPKGSPDVWLPNSLYRWRDLSYAVNDCYRATNIPKVWSTENVLKSCIYHHNQ